MEHLSLPDDPASRRLFGVPIVATVSEAAGVGHVLATDAVVVDTEARVWGAVVGDVQHRRLREDLIRARCEGRFGTSLSSPLGAPWAPTHSGHSHSRRDERPPGPGNARRRRR